MTVEELRAVGDNRVVRIHFLSSQQRLRVSGYQLSQAAVAVNPGVGTLIAFMTACRPLKVFFRADNGKMERG